jgi:hypothetical protein
MALHWPAYFSTSTNPCVRLKLLRQCKANILSTYCDPNNCYLLSLRCKTTSAVNCCVIYCIQLFCYNTCLTKCSIQAVLSCDIKATFATEVLLLQGTPQELCILLLNWGGGGDKRQVVIHTVHSKLQFPSKVSLAYVAFVITVLTLLLPEYLQMALIHY